MSTFPGFPKDTRRFLLELSENNNREWFAVNKQRYEQSFLAPSLELIRSLEKPLAKTAPLLIVEPKKTGGSLMRIYKDTRFSKDKTPYKTNIGLHFRHRAGKDVHAPGVYLHIAADECFLGAGIWKPPSDALRRIRELIVEDPAAWKRILKHKKFSASFDMFEDRLKSAPRGFDKQHPSIDDLRQRSFLGMASLPPKQIEGKSLVTTVTKLVADARPLMAYLCRALDQPY
jgi:uncharacterized protein (TIGR02453 family)